MQIESTKFVIKWAARAHAKTMTYKSTWRITTTATKCVNSRTKNDADTHVLAATICVEIFFGRLFWLPSVYFILLNLFRSLGRMSFAWPGCCLLLYGIIYCFRFTRSNCNCWFCVWFCDLCPTLYCCSSISLWPHILLLCVWVCVLSIDIQMLAIM